MNQDTVYAVIDLETTGPDAAGGDRIIQFGCALIKNRQIIQTLSQLINPDKQIPRAIQQLTGITPKMLVAAPYFDEVAGTLASMLQGKVIIAHNVNFDYPFLSKELERCGEAALTNRAIDTVQLAQIILPTEQSYRLSDLTRKLGIEHNNPHRADSDAISTAKLFMHLEDEFARLPGPVQRSIADHSDFLVRDTEQVLKDLAARAPKLRGKYLKVGQLVLRTPARMRSDKLGEKHYPTSDKEKKRLLRKAHLRFRFAQAKMMDAIADNAQQQQEPLFIEAGTGLGKSLAYLLPYVFLATPERKLVVATSTTVLQDQLANSTMHQLEIMLGGRLNSAVLKSPRHLLDLNKFATSLGATGMNKADKMLQLRILSWLSKTRTGDLDELQLSSLQTPLLQQIRHTGDCGTPESNPYYEVDFYVRLQQAAADSAIVITNHAYLIHHYQEDVFGGEPYLVVDEAQNFPDSATSGFEVKLDFTKLRRALQRFTTLLHRQEGGLSAAYADDELKQYQIASVLTAASDCLSTVQSLQQYLASQYVYPNSQGGRVREYALTYGELSDILLSTATDIRSCVRQVNQILQFTDLSRSDYLSHQQRFAASDIRVFQQLDELAAVLRDCLPALEQVLTDDPQLLNPMLRMAFVQMRHKDDVSSLVLRWRVIDPRSQIQTLLARFAAPVFTSATLTVRKKPDYVAHALGYSAVPDERALRLRSPFKYRNLARIMIAKGAPEPPKTQTDSYVDYLARSIAALADNQHQTLVLFNSLKLIAAVYERLSTTALSERKEILAQGVTGSAGKIARRFAAGDGSLLLGAASFFEGIDYPAKQLETIILTRLPFEAPNDAIAAARAAIIRDNGGDAFKDDILPRATLRLRQAFGRLIRTEEDRGVFIVLDPRFTQTQFGRNMQKSLPNVDTDLLPISAMPEVVETWLKPIEEENGDQTK
jgi:ATP-dependent DNA helicase DinG